MKILLGKYQIYWWNIGLKYLCKLWPTNVTIKILCKNIPMSRARTAKRWSRLWVKRSTDSFKSTFSSLSWWSEESNEATGKKKIEHLLTFLPQKIENKGTFWKLYWVRIWVILFNSSWDLKFAYFIHFDDSSYQKFYIHVQFNFLFHGKNDYMYVNWKY